jgi:hypothetical protein
MSIVQVSKGVRVAFVLAYTFQCHHLFCYLDECQNITGDHSWIYRPILTIQYISHRLGSFIQHLQYSWTQLNCYRKTRVWNKIIDISFATCAQSKKCKHEAISSVSMGYQQASLSVCRKTLHIWTPLTTPYRTFLIFQWDFKQLNFHFIETRLRLRLGYLLRLITWQFNVVCAASLFYYLSFSRRLFNRFFLRLIL